MKNKVEYILYYTFAEKGKVAYRIIGPVNTDRCQDRTYRLTNHAPLPSGGNYDITMENGGGFFGIPDGTASENKEQEAPLYLFGDADSLMSTIKESLEKISEELMGEKSDITMTVENITNNKPLKTKLNLSHVKRT